MRYSVCLDLLYLELSPNGPIWADTEKILQGMELAKELGYKEVEFWDWFNKDLEAIEKKLKELDLKLSSICAKDRGTIADASTHEKAIESLKETIEVAKRLGTDKIIVTAQNVEGISREESYKNIVVALKKMAIIAEENDVVLILEPIWGSYFTDSAEPFAIVDEVGSPKLKVLYDLYHYQMMEGNLINTIKKNLDKIGHIHIASTPARTEIIEGELNYEFILKEIKKMDFKDAIALEYRPTMGRKESLEACTKILA